MEQDNEDQQQITSNYYSINSADFMFRNDKDITSNFHWELIYSYIL